MAIATREVEVYRCWDDRTWDTEFVEIPADTPENDIGKAAEHAALEAMRNSADLPVVVGVYCIPDPDEDEE